MTSLAPASWLRTTALSASLVLVLGLWAGAADARKGAKVPIPKPRPISRHVIPKTAAAAAPHGKTISPDKATAPPSIQAATRQHAALPPPSKRKPVPEAAMAAPGMIVVLQAVWLTPELDARVGLILGGRSPPPSNLHIVYIVAEGLKIVVLLWFGFAGPRPVRRRPRDCRRPPPGPSPG